MEDDDPLQWELDQVDKLDQLAAVYGWEKGDKNYNARIKLIQVQSVARQKANAKGASAVSRGASSVRLAGSEAVHKAAGVKRSKPHGWTTVDPISGKRFKSFATAKALLGPAEFSNWITDRDSPAGTKPTAWRRFISISKTTGEFVRYRIVRNKGE